MSAATDKTNLAELRRTMTLWHNRVTALGFDGVSDVIALAEAGGDQMKKAWPIGERIALKLLMIKQIGEGSTTANSLPHVARIADEALECIRQRPAAQAGETTPEPVGEPVAWRYKIPTHGGGTAWTHTRPQPECLIEAQPLYTHPAPGVPDVLFDGFAVLKALTPQAERRTSAENVSDVLDAAVRLIRSAQAKGGDHG